MGFIIQIGFAIMLFLFATAVAWYEGSALLNDPWEWKYTTPFSGEVTQESDISQLDFFFYAAKFEPTFPLLMATSLLYIIVLVAYRSFNNQRKGILFFSCFGASLLISSSFMIQSPTIGAALFTKLFITAGILCIGSACYQFFRLRKKTDAMI
ncbi:YjdJ family protein [Pseudalkalibacillus sp. Hm43]|uniref:YjdJ family protein n=1 Tax=Pseudalkalibacillus sp. Hm43 TaxID=3450742 RepID=UPI003F42F1E4